MKPKKIAVAMSGGVDSSVVAALLVRQGYKVTGVYLEAYNEPGCRTDQDKAEALKVAIKLGVPFKVLDLRKEYREKVTNYFVESYRRGETPNPDVVCNREIKFGEYYGWAMAEGFDLVATGHYARVYQGENEKRFLQRSRDLAKDQSYFLWQVAPQYLEHVVFPLGEMKKKEVREKARSLGLPNAEKPDSMGVCMMGKLNVREFLKNKLEENEGEVVMRSKTGEELVVGRHQGMWTATVGERVGKEITLEGTSLKRMGIDTTKMPILYVVGKMVEENMIMIGRKEECYRKIVQTSRCKFELSEEELGRLVKENNLLVRIRNLGELYKITKLKTQKSKLMLETKEPVFAPTRGQSAVLYAKVGKEGEEIVVGGGIIV
ncbi:MAG: tRNA 2-thiouridine(34) synthase MnmA [bacterium]